MLGIFSPSSSIQTEKFNSGLSVLEKHGLKTLIHPQTYDGSDSGTQFAGSPQSKAAALMELWSDPSVTAIMASCGGNFSAQFLHLLDFKKMAATPKPVIGFSDTTALLSALYAQTGIGGFFAPTVQTIGRLEQSDKILEQLFNEAAQVIELNDGMHLNNIQTSAKAPLYAATLTVLMSLAGTKYFPDLSGHILILEDIGEELSNLDRLLWQLNTLCPFSKLAGLVFGDFVDLKNTGRPLGLDLNGILTKHTAGLNIPVLTNAPIGHGGRFVPIPLGRKAILDCTSSPRLILES